MVFEEQYNKVLQRFKHEAVNVIVDFFDTDFACIDLPKYVDYVAPAGFGYFDPAYPDASIENVNYKLNDCISKFLIYFIVFVLTELGFKVNEADKNGVVKITKGDTNLQVIFFTHQYFEVDNNEFGLIRSENLSPLSSKKQVC